MPIEDYHSKARKKPITKEYEEGYDRIFGKEKDNKNKKQNNGKTTNN